MKTTIGLAALFVIVLVGGYVLMKPTPQAPATSVSSDQAQSTSGTNAVSSDTAGQTTSSAPIKNKPGSYTSAEVATHATSKSCWASINGNVYDLTSWISQHPGGEARILNICGKDGTSAFMGQHGNDSQAQAMLATFKIGTLVS